MRAILFILLFSLTTAFSNQTLKSRIIKGKPGDFIVTQQGGSYSVIFIRSCNDTRLVLEEVSIDQSLVDLKKVSWKNWIEKKAPGASSWTSLAIDLEKNRLAQCYSYTQSQWLFIENSDYYFEKLLSLPLQATRDHERKKIGPAPMPGEIDRRKFWKPQLMRNGKKISQTEYEVIRAKWPLDNTKVAGSIIELYLDAANPVFPFPYCLEVQSPHYTFKLRTVDSGSGILSPVPAI